MWSKKTKSQHRWKVNVVGKSEMTNKSELTMILTNDRDRNRDKRQVRNICYMHMHVNSGICIYLQKYFRGWTDNV